MNKLQTRLATPLGHIRICVDGNETACRWQPLPLEGKGFRVDLRVLCRIELATNGPHRLLCGFTQTPEQDLDWDPETGEKLALVSYQQYSFRLCLSSPGDIPGRGKLH